MNVRDRFGGAKLAGLLLEAETLPGGRRAAVIGFGVNVAAAPDGLAAMSLAAAGYADKLTQKDEYIAATIDACASDKASDFSYLVKAALSLTAPTFCAAAARMYSLMFSRMLLSSDSTSVTCPTAWLSISE